MFVNVPNLIKFLKGETIESQMIKKKPLTEEERNSLIIGKMIENLAPSRDFKSEL